MVQCVEYGYDTRILSFEEYAPLLAHSIVAYATMIKLLLCDAVHRGLAALLT